MSQFAVCIFLKTVRYRTVVSASEKLAEDGLTRGRGAPAREVVKLRQELYGIYAERTGKTYQQIHDDSDRDFWLRADEAKEYGLIDEVLTRPAG